MLPELPEIRIVSNYDPSEYSFLASEAALIMADTGSRPGHHARLRQNARRSAERISNPNGSLFVTSAAGDIYVDGSITAGSVSILARNGDFVQRYVNGFNSVAGEPEQQPGGG